MDTVAIAYNSDTNECCLVKSNATFEMLEKDFDLYNVKFSATNWGGRDTLERTERQENIKADFSKSFEKSGILEGSDYDCAHEYPWTFKYDKIVKVESFEYKEETKKSETENDPYFDIDFTKLEVYPKWVKLGYKYDESYVENNSFKLTTENCILSEEATLWINKSGMMTTYPMLNLDILELLCETIKEIQKYYSKEEK